MKTPEILIINNGLSGGGIERASVSLANFWAEQGFKITILALYQSDHFFPLHPSIRLIEPNFSRQNLSRIAYLIRMIFFTRKQIKKINPDTILAFSEWTNPYVVLAWLGLPQPLYLSDRMSPLMPLPFISEILRKLLYRKANGIVAQSKFAAQILQKKTKSSNIQVINNPVNPVEKIDIPVRNRIVTVGRLSPEKGHLFLLEAFAALHHPTWELSIVGDGVEMENLKQLAQKLGIANRVIFHGHLKDFRAQLSEAQIFVLPSLQEGFPNALLEAMSVPLACISTDFFEGNHEIILHGINGLIVKPGDSQSLSEAMKLLIENEQLRIWLAKNAYKVRSDYSFEKISQQYLNFILHGIDY